MSHHNFEHNVQERAYYKFLNEKDGKNDFQIWEEAEREQIIHDKIEEEAFYRFLNGSKDPVYNWVTAEHEINQRVGFLAFYMHEANYNRSAEENWIEAQKLYIHQY